MYSYYLKTKLLDSIGKADPKLQEPVKEGYKNPGNKVSLAQLVQLDIDTAVDGVWHFVSV